MSKILTQSILECLCVCVCSECACLTAAEWTNHRVPSLFLIMAGPGFDRGLCLWVVPHCWASLRYSYSEAAYSQHAIPLHRLSSNDLRW